MGVLLLPFIWFFMLLELIYKLILQIGRRLFYKKEPGTPRKRQDKTGENRPRTTDEQRIFAEPERNQPTDDGMNPHERILPYITPVKEQDEPEFVFEIPQRGKRDDRGRG